MSRESTYCGTVNVLLLDQRARDSFIMAVIKGKASHQKSDAPGGAPREEITGYPAVPGSRSLGLSVPYRASAVTDKP